jgi:cob(I)alamin adenosyltransferase
MITNRKGLVQVYTGNGKGKTTAALGLALRAVGQGRKVYMIQFMKGWPLSRELETSKCIPNLTLRQFGRPNFVSKKSPHPIDICLAQEALAHAHEIVMAGRHDLVILDEVNVALDFRMIPLAEVLDLLEKRPPHVEMVLTGRDAPAELIARADLVTEMLQIKHPFTEGVEARQGIEF